MNGGGELRELWILDPSLLHEEGHNAQWAEGLLAAAGETPVCVFANVRFEPAAGTRMAQATRRIYLHDYYGRALPRWLAAMFGSMGAPGRAFGYLLSTLRYMGDLARTPAPPPGVTVLVHTIRLNQLTVLSWWLLRRARPGVRYCVVLHWADHPKPRLTERLGMALLDLCRRVMKSRLAIFTINDSVMEILPQSLRAVTKCCPVPIGLTHLGEAPPRRPGSADRPRFVLPGQLREEKGGELAARAWPALVGKHSGAKLVLQSGESRDAEWGRDLIDVSELAGAHPGSVVKLPLGLSRDRYYEMLIEASFLLLPYKGRYSRAVSGILIEASMLGIPVIVSDGTWLSGRLRAGRAVGIVLREYSTEALIAACDEAIARFDELQRQAMELAPRMWEIEGAAAFLKLLAQPE